MYVSSSSDSFSSSETRHRPIVGPILSIFDHSQAVQLGRVCSSRLTDVKGKGEQTVKGKCLPCGLVEEAPDWLPRQVVAGRLRHESLDRMPIAALICEPRHVPSRSGLEAARLVASTTALSLQSSRGPSLYGND